MREWAVDYRRKFDNGYQGTDEYPEYIDHYLYFSTQADADNAAKLLLARGWRVTVTPSAGGTELAGVSDPAGARR